MRSWIRKTLLLAAMASSATAAHAQYSPNDVEGDSPVQAPISEPLAGYGVPGYAAPGYATPIPGYAPPMPGYMAAMPVSAAAMPGMPSPDAMPGGAPYGYGDPTMGGVANPGISGRSGPFAGQRWPTLIPGTDRFSVRGWLDGGYVYNESQPNSHYNGPYNSIYRANEGSFNQAYGIFEYLLPQDGAFGFGARVDALWGQDYLLAQSLGWELQPNGAQKWNSNVNYGVATPQMYGQVGTMASNLKVGHFYSIVGYEGVPSANNFFYSKAYSYQFAGPFTHWGAIVSHMLSENLEVQAGAHLGWNTLDTTHDNVSGIAGIKYYGRNRNWWTSFAVTSGQAPTNPSGNPDIQSGFSNRTRYSFIIDVNLTCNLEWVAHHWLGFQEDGGPGGRDAYWYGVDQYLYYRINDYWKFGGRAEWFRDEDGTRVGLTLPNNPNRAPLPGNYYSGTIGFNYTPWSNLTIRPEARWDFSANTTTLPYADGTRQNQFMVAVDAILKF